MRGKGRVVFLLGLATVVVAVLAACTPTEAPATPVAATPVAKPGTPAAATPAAGVVAGDVNAGKQLIVSKGCSGCHVVPGVPEAKGTVGPSLAGVGGRAQIAGVVPNTPENMAGWLKNPPGVKPGTQMPNLGLSDKEAADLTAFLATLR